MSDTGFIIPSAGANDNSVGGTAWTNPGNITAEDGTNATITLVATQGSQLLKGTNIGSTVPSTATIDGIIAGFKVSTSAANVARDNNVYLYKAGTKVGNNKATNTNWTTTPTWVDYGGASDLWGTTWTAAEVNASGFGAGIGVLCVANGTSNVDAHRVKVFYTDAVPTTLTLTLSALTKGAFELTIQQAYTLGLTLSVVNPIWPALALAPPMTLDMELSTLPYPTTLAFLVEPGISLNLSLSTLQHEAFSFDFSIVLGLTLSTLPRTSSFTNDLTWGTQSTLTLSELPKIVAPILALTHGITLVMPSLSELPKKISGELYAYFPVESGTKYLQAQRSGVTQIIFGAETGVPFLLNKAANNYRRRGKMQLLHTGKVKPQVSEIDAVFTVITPTGTLEPNDFLYEAPGGYLRIRNPNVIDVMMTQDGDTAAIPVTPTKVDIRQESFFTSFHQ